MYRIIEREVGHPAHSGETLFSEVEVWEGQPPVTLIKTFTGPNARIAAREHIKSLGWSKPARLPDEDLVE